jgi:hypothetical protein
VFSSTFNGERWVSKMLVNAKRPQLQQLSVCALQVRRKPNASPWTSISVIFLLAIVISCVWVLSELASIGRTTITEDADDE